MRPARNKPAPAPRPAFTWKRRGTWHSCYLGELFVGEVCATQEDTYWGLARKARRPAASLEEGKERVERGVLKALGWQ